MNQSEHRAFFPAPDRRKRRFIGSARTFISEHYYQDDALFLAEPPTDTPSLQHGDYRAEHSRSLSEQIASGDTSADRDRHLHQARNLESLSVLAGGIAHGFNNLLAVISGRCQLALMNCGRADEHIPVIIEAADKAAELCRQMLDYAGAGQAGQGRVDMSHLLAELSDTLKSSAGSGIELSLDITNGLPNVCANADQLKQTVVNLVTNAVESIGHSQGKITVSLTLTELKPGETVLDHKGQSLPPFGYICLEVTDNGCGMDDETQRRVCEPFYTTKFTGRGLGMSAVHGIIRAHRGALQIFSQPGLGSTIKVLLPVLPPKIDGYHAPSTMAPHDTWRGSGTVLLVEDDEQLSIILETMMKEIGFQVITAANGRQALETYLAGTVTISLIVTDIDMPVMDGYELVSEIRTRDRSVPIIISSGFGAKDIRSRTVHDQVSGIVSKPFKYELLRSVVKEVMLEKTVSPPV